MIKAIHLFATAFAIILVCSAAGAQALGGSVRVAPMARVSSAPRSAGHGRPIRALPNGRAIPGFTSFANSANFVSTTGVPGLGFDYAHLAAIAGGLRSSRSSSGGRGTHRGQSVFIPILYGGYPYYDYSNDDSYADTSDYEQPQQQPQVIVVQQPVQQTADSGNDSASPPMISPAAPAVAPVRDVGEFDLVRRDGRVLFASAFSVVGAQLTYVTPEGFRRTLPMSELDVDATQQMNEARGTTVQIHN